MALNGKVLALKESLDEAYSHSEKLNLFIDEALRQSGIDFKDLDAVAVSKGPGSYTGLRIGVSTAKGLAFALDIPIIGIDTLAGMTAGFIEKYKPGKASRLVPMIDARRMEVYMRIFDYRSKPLTATEARVVDALTFDDENDFQYLLFGDGAGKFTALFENHPGVKIIPDFHPSAGFMARLAEQRFRAAKFEDTAYFEPYYLKDFIAIKPRNLFD